MLRMRSLTVKNCFTDGYEIYQVPYEFTKICKLLYTQHSYMKRVQPFP
jgi:hypothetical protein